MANESPIAASRFGISIDGVQTTQSSQDTFDFSNLKEAEDSDGDVNSSDLLIWQSGREGDDTSSDTNEPGLPGVTIYSDINLGGELDTSNTTFSDDLIA